MLGSVQSCMATSNNALMSMPVHLQSSGACFLEKSYRHVSKLPWNGVAQGSRGTMTCPTSPGPRVARRMPVLAKATGDAPWASKPAARYVTCNSDA